MDFKNISDGELVTKLKNLVIEERKLTTDILQFLREVEARRLFALWGYPSLFEFCTKELAYSAGAAQRRIESMRLLKSIGEAASKKIEERLQEGKVNLTHLSLLQNFVRNKEKQNNQKIKPEEKLTWLNQMASRPTRECEKILHSIDPTVPVFQYEKERVIAENRIELKFSVSDSLMSKLERIRELRAHVNPKMTYEEMLEYLAEITLEMIDPERRAKRIQEKNTAKQQGESQENSSEQLIDSLETEANILPAPEVKIMPEKKSPRGIAQKRSLENAATVHSQHPVKRVGHPQPPTKTASHPSSMAPSSRSIPAHIKRKVWLRDGGRCTYQSLETGRVCGSHYGLEFEHRHPFALGGQHTEANVTLHCKAHNLTQAFKQFGEIKMKTYVKN